MPAHTHAAAQAALEALFDTGAIRPVAAGQPLDQADGGVRRGRREGTPPGMKRTLALCVAQDITAIIARDGQVLPHGAGVRGRRWATADRSLSLLAWFDVNRDAFALDAWTSVKVFSAVFDAAGGADAPLLAISRFDRGGWEHELSRLRGAPVAGRIFAPGVNRDGAPALISQWQGRPDQVPVVPVPDWAVVAVA